ncbi:carbon storage regulator [Legionella septentrionalis]|uniref:carbon storage regulator n=1 Tax=Legionella septentrionalis TaxID=2498109 RepID=UPI000F8E0CEA|nr:carbon storage regulator [Legionella septentrionalis]RUR14036.1 carbon storage regulator [Legionella septentrionalis]HAT9646629.1 carbon storage regulator [Legionella pneumophila subsp. pneumophila]
MLILYRKIGEQIMIDKGSIQIKVMDVNADNGVIAIGFKAPAHVDIDREEIFLKKLIESPAVEGAKL